MFGECSGVEFLKHVAHTPAMVAKEIFDLEVYELHSEGEFFQVNFKNYTPIYSAPCNSVPRAFVHQYFYYCTGSKNSSW